MYISVCVCISGYTINIYSWHGKVLKIVYGVIVIFYEATLLHYPPPPTPRWAEMPLPAPGTGFQSFIQYIIALCIHPPAYTPSPFDGANTFEKVAAILETIFGWGMGRCEVEGRGFLFVHRSLLFSLRLKFYNKFVTKIDLCAINDKNEKKTLS